VNNIILFETFFLENHWWGWKISSEFSKCLIGLLVGNLGAKDFSSSKSRLKHIRINTHPHGVRY
jgi:hypothetical protein